MVTEVEHFEDTVGTLLLVEVSYGGYCEIQYFHKLYFLFQVNIVPHILVLMFVNQ